MIAAAAGRRAVGTRWEDAALAHLQGAGLKLLARNFGCRYGELDLVMRERDCVVFVEVRYRESADRGDGLASVGAAKRAKLVRAAAVYLAANPQLAACACRFDIVACAGSHAQPVIDWQSAVFEAYR